MTDKYIYILLMHTGTILDRTIRILTRYPYSHAALSLDDTYTKFYSFGRKKVHNIFYAGLVTYGMDGAFFKAFKDTEVKVLRLKVSRKSYNKLKSILHNFEDYADMYKYDTKGLFVRLLRKKSYRREKYYVCTVFVAEVLKRAKIYEFNKPIDRIKADDFTKIPNIEVIYEGKLNKIKE